MEIKSFLDQKEKICDLLLAYIDNENDNIDKEEFSRLMEKINQETEKKFDLKEFLHLVLSITDNHHRKQHFFERIEKILLLIKDQIKQSFSDSEIFELFVKNKRLLLTLFELKIIDINDPSIQEFFKKTVSSMQNDEIDFHQSSSPMKEELIRKFKQFRQSNHIHDKKEIFLCYFYPEIELFIEPTLKETLFKKLTQFSEYSEFINNRKIGENDSIICSLIRDDKIDEFVPYITKKNFSFSSIITPSIFESNRFLIKRLNVTSLIEYAAFYGSIQIFNYLRFNGANMNPSLWLYAIHGKNAEIIHLLEENELAPPGNNYKFCLMEAIKCHHNDIAEYIENKYQASMLIENKHLILMPIKNKHLISKTMHFTSTFDQLTLNKPKNFDACTYSFKFHNYHYMKYFFNNDLALLYSCQYDHYSIVNFLIKQDKNNFKNRHAV